MKKYEADTFLKNMYELYLKYNNVYHYTQEDFQKVVYRNLQIYGLPQIDDESRNIEPFFDQWINDFKNSDTEVFQDENNPYFCRFIRDKNNSLQTVENPIKLYIPLDKSHIYNGANLIFNYLEKEDIAHESKISKLIRSDDIVIRVAKPTDAMKIMSFVKNNPYLKEGSLNPNPFFIQKDNIGFACDNNYSYNDEVAKHISKYILSRANNGNVSIEDLGLFIKQNAQNSDPNLEQINILILNALQSNDLKLFFSHHRLINGNMPVEQESFFEQPELEEQQLLKALQYTIELTQTNHNEHQARHALLEFLTTGNTKFFSRYQKINGKKDKSINFRKVLSTNEPTLRKVVTDLTMTSNPQDQTNIFYEQYVASQNKNKQL